MKRWKRRALEAEARLKIAQYHFDVVWTYADGHESLQDNVAVVNGTLDVSWCDENGVRRDDVVNARVYVRKVVDGVLVSQAPTP